MGGKRKLFLWTQLHLCVTMAAAKVRDALRMSGAFGARNQLDGEKSGPLAGWRNQEAPWEGNSIILFLKKNE